LEPPDAFDLSRPSQQSAPDAWEEQHPDPPDAWEEQHHDPPDAWEEQHHDPPDAWEEQHHDPPDAWEEQHPDPPDASEVDASSSEPSSQSEDSQALQAELQAKPPACALRPSNFCKKTEISSPFAIFIRVGESRRIVFCKLEHFIGSAESATTKAVHRIITEAFELATRSSTPFVEKVGICHRSDCGVECTAALYIYFPASKPPHLKLYFCSLICLFGYLGNLSGYAWKKDVCKYGGYVPPKRTKKQKTPTTSKRGRGKSGTQATQSSTRASTRKRRQT